MQKIITFGILGAANIAKTRLVPAMKGAFNAQFWGVGSRSLATADSFVKEVGEGRAYEGYGAVLADPEVQAIYNPLPNDLHVSQTVAALAKGKHVLCEKPIALNADEANELRLEAKKYPDLKVMEAFMYRFHPQWQLVRDWIDGGLIGDMRSISSQFTFFNEDPSNIRNRPEAGGGALMDVGCYGISSARLVTGLEPQKVIAITDMHPEYKVDNSTHLILSFPNGVAATVYVSTKSCASQAMSIEDSKGRITLSHPFYSNEGDVRTVTLETQDAEQQMTFGGEIDQYQLMVESFVSSIHDDTPVGLSLEESVANMAVIDAAFASAESESWVDVKTY